MGKHMGLEKYQNIITRLYKIRSNAIRVSTKNQMCNSNSKRTKYDRVWVFHWNSSHQYYDLIEILVYFLIDNAVFRNKGFERICKTLKKNFGVISEPSVSSSIVYVRSVLCLNFVKNCT